MSITEPPIYITHKNGYYGSMYGCGFDDMKGFYTLVRKAKALGADFIKITMTGMLDFDNGGEIMGPVLSAKELREAVNIADGEGFAVMAHVNGGDNIKIALEAGVASIEHGFWPDGSVIDYFLQTGGVLGADVRNSVQHHRQRTVFRQCDEKYL